MPKFQLQDNINRNAFVLYSVLLGFAVKEALWTAIPQIISANSFPYGPDFSNVHRNSTLALLQVVRLIAFLFLTIRFFLGSAYFFHLAYGNKDAETDFPVKNIGADAIFLFIQAVGFLSLAFSISVQFVPTRLFVFSLLFVLLYDLFWYSFSLGKSTSRLLFFGTVVNLLTALLATLIYMVVFVTSFSAVRAEIAALILVLMVSALDVGFLMRGMPFGKWLKRLLLNTGPASSASTGRDVDFPE